MDNRRLITEYLTRATLRLIDPDSDVNKSRCDYCAFWKALRATKQMEVRRSKKQLKLVRDYSRNKSIDAVKKRMTNSIITYGLYIKGINDDDVLQDAVDAVVMLNDNDIQNMKKYKVRKSYEFSQDDLQNPIAEISRNRGFIDFDTGELL